jgi:hypothetical protein
MSEYRSAQGEKRLLAAGEEVCEGGEARRFDTGGAWRGDTGDRPEI